MPDQARFLSTERLKDVRLSQASPELGDETTEKNLHTLFRGKGRVTLTSHTQASCCLSIK